MLPLVVWACPGHLTPARMAGGGTSHWARPPTAIVFDRPFEGLPLAVTPAQALACLERAVERLSAIATAPGGPAADDRAQAAVAALAYLVIEHDLGPDLESGGLVDDLAVVAGALASLEPEVLSGWPDALLVIRMDPRTPLWSDLWARLQRIASIASPPDVVRRARAKVDAVHTAVAAGRLITVARRPVPSGTGPWPVLDPAAGPQGSLTLYLYLTLIALLARGRGRSPGPRPPSPPPERRPPALGVSAELDRLMQEYERRMSGEEIPGPP